MPRRVVKTLSVLALIALSPILPSNIHTTPRALGNTTGPLIAFALNGDIYAQSIAGGAPHRLTNYGHNSAPVLSPHGRLIAYLSASPRYIDKYGYASTHSVWVVPVDGQPDGSDARKLTVTNPAIDRAGLSWSPDGQSVAYYEGATVIVSAYDGTHRHVVLHLTKPTQTTTFAMAQDSPIIWSPDGRLIAVIAPHTMSAPATTLRLITADLASGKTTSSMISFPAGALKAMNGEPHATVTARDLTWTRDGTHVLVETIVSGAGDGLLGLWRASVRGGRAVLVIGPSTLAPLRMMAARHIVLSPDGTHLLADPTGGLLVGDAAGMHERYLVPPPDARSECVIAQELWTTDSADIAYVAVCGTNRETTSHGSTVVLTHATLSVARLSDSSTRPLLSNDSADQGSLQITPLAYRCIQCGG